MDCTKPHRIVNSHLAEVQNESDLSNAIEVSGDIKATGKPHLEAGNLHSGRVSVSLAWFFDCILTTLPILFFALAVSVLRLDGQPTSKIGGRIVDITRLGPTLYPILFAMISSRFYKNLARWSLERPGGIKLSWLEQIFGSLSFASAVERLVTVRSNLVIGASILMIWSLSPIGGQSSSRLLYVAANTTTSDDIVYYAHVDYQTSYYIGGSDMTIENILRTVYSASLLIPAVQQRAFSDLWGKPRIPQWPLQEDQTPVNSWRQVNTSALVAGDEYYTSFIGTKVQGLVFADSTSKYNLSLQSSYMDFVCNIDSTYTSDVELDVLDELLLYETGYNRTAMLDKWSFGLAFSRDQNGDSLTGSWEQVPKHLLYLSLSDMPFAGTLITCKPEIIDIETTMLCDARECFPARQRRIKSPRPPNQAYPTSMFGGTNLRNMMRTMPSLAGDSRSHHASPSENYLANDEFAYASQFRRKWDDAQMPVFSRRLTTLWNTAWQAGLNPRNISTQFTTGTPVPGGDDHGDGSTAEATVGGVKLNTTLAVVSRTRDVYRADLAWVAVLLFATAVLEGLALAGLALRFLIKGPDILGFASSLTRDNRFVPVPGGSSLDGAERARLLGDLRLRLADVRAEQEDGYIAICTMPGTSSVVEVVGDEQIPSLTWRPFDKNRVYI